MGRCRFRIHELQVILPVTLNAVKSSACFVLVCQILALLCMLHQKPSSLPDTNQSPMRH